MSHSRLKADGQAMSQFIAMAINLKSHSVKSTSLAGQWTTASWDLRHSSGGASQSHWLDTTCKLPSLLKLLLDSFRDCVWTHCLFTAEGVVTFTFALTGFRSLIGIHVIRIF